MGDFTVMAKNDFKPFATGASANVITQAEYEALTALLTGFQAGKASSAQINKAIRQATFVAAALAQYITNKTGQDVPDNGDIAAFITKMAAALGKDFQALDAALTSLAALPGTADTLAYFTGPDTLALTNLTAAGRNLINKADVASIIQYLGLQNTITQAANAVQRIGDTMSWLNVTGLIQSASMRVNTPASPSVQGLTIDWNGIGFGTAGLTNNRGSGQVVLFSAQWMQKIKMNMAGSPLMKWARFLPGVTSMPGLPNTPLMAIATAPYGVLAAIANGCQII
jgi:hypothetical protein